MLPIPDTPAPRILIFYLNVAKMQQMFAKGLTSVLHLRMLRPHGCKGMYSAIAIKFNPTFLEEK